MNKEINNEYFEYMYNIVCGRRFNKISYRKLLMFLHSKEFTYIIPMDENRALDGIDLRYKFANDFGYEDIDNYIKGPCSILEMMIALSIRCEKTIMDDPSVGDRTGQWFWDMIVNLGLGSMTDNRFDKKYASEVIYKFLNREYEPNGKGGLFKIRNCTEDLRKIEIWHQLCWYLNSIL